VQQAGSTIPQKWISGVRTGNPLNTRPFCWFAAAIELKIAAGITSPKFFKIF
jgi:hypothetical protein